MGEAHESSGLSSAERQEVRELYERLHYLYPNRGYDRDARGGFPPNAGRGELDVLRREVEYEEDRSAATRGGPPRSQYQMGRDDLAQLREDAYYVREVGVDPDRLYDASSAELGNEALQRFARRRPQLERQLDALARDAEAGDVELTDDQREMIQALGELREAEEHARDRGQDRDDDEHGREA